MELQMTKLLADLYRRKEVKKLEVIKEGLIVRKAELDNFFEEYLELFDEKMSAIEDQSHPIWKAYKVRYKEWQKVNGDLKLANYYMGIV